MKITAFSESYTLGVAATGDALASADGSNGRFAGDIAGEAIDLSVVGLRRQVSIASNLAPMVVGDALTIVQTSPTVVARFATSSNSAIGSNSVTRTLGGQETIVTHAASGAARTLDLGGGNVFDVTLTANCTLAFSGVPAGVAAGITVLLRQDGTGSRTVTWPGSVVWAGSAPVLATTPAEVDVVTLFTIDGGTVWYGFPTGGGGVSGGTPALTLGTANAAGVATTAILTDASIAVFDATAPTTAAFGDAAATGSAAVAARRDHRHGMPSGSGQILVSDTPAGSPLVFADLLQNEAGTDLLYAD